MHSGRLPSTWRLLTRDLFLQTSIPSKAVTRDRSPEQFMKTHQHWQIAAFYSKFEANYWRGGNTVLGTAGSHKWVTQVFTEGSILAGEGTHLAKDNNRSLSSLPKPPWLVPKEVWWKPNTQACVSPSYTEIEKLKVLIGRRNPYL